MDLSEFTANYAHLSDDEILRLWADRNTLVPDAVMALESELQRRGLSKQSAARVKKRLDTLEERQASGPLINQVRAAKYERNMRHFVGWEEPKFSSPYGRRDIRTTFASIRHRYRVWKAFRDHTGHWPILSICFHFVSWLTVLGLTVYALKWMGEHHWRGSWTMVAIVCWFLLLLVTRDFGARQMRKLDWKRYGT